MSKKAEELAVLWTELAKEGSDIIVHGGSQKRLDEIFEQIESIREELKVEREKMIER